MLVQRTDDEVIIRLSASVDTQELQRLLDYLRYKEATSTSRATQADVDKLSRLVKKNRRAKNRRKFAK
ncbi:MAG: hypothetical protein HY22_08705 [[Candidatus Thermochlorobacteriaceae] bacterium GBChlB]|nr:MAG: hypothetical protein HY22_08705 [[Candidatus Thermochlorobacteriaceae] bacterium GBChlB]